ncbi:MAG: sulfotransferase [Actinomycetia bacterium]|nr:sulfotransferase [Actinomycetes bacterium]MCP3911939.1 sulfotransferase [Actinomycetes bacterium]MCP4086709.1 sulfotransferase [Actinomycetes bacterium]
MSEGEKVSERVPVVYVGGVGRSGSTLLDLFVGQDPRLFPVGELVHLWDRGLRNNNRCGTGEPFSDSEFWCQVGEKAFGGWDQVDVDRMAAMKAAVDRNRFVPQLLTPWSSPGFARDIAAYGEAMAAIYRAVLAVSGASVVVDSSKHISTAAFLRRVPAIDLRVLHLVRDSRGVAFSWTKQVKMTEVVAGDEEMERLHPVHSAWRWDCWNSLFTLLGRLGVPSSRLRYEDLISDPAGAVEKVLDLAGLEGNCLVVTDDGVKVDPIPSLGGNPSRFRTGTVTVRVDDAWRRELPGASRVFVTALTAPLLAAYGYPIGGGGS